MNKSEWRNLQKKRHKSCKILSAHFLLRFSLHLKKSMKKERVQRGRKNKKHKRTSGNTYTTRLKRRKNCKTRQQKRSNGKKHSKNANLLQKSTKSMWKELKQQKLKLLSVSRRELNRNTWQTSCNHPKDNPHLQVLVVRHWRNSKIKLRTQKFPKSW